MLRDRVKVATATTGTGAVAPGAAAVGFNAFPAAAATGTVFPYVLEDAGSAFEVGVGFWNATSGLLSRIPSSSSNGVALINLTGGASLYLTARGDDIGPDPYVTSRWYPSERANQIGTQNGATSSNLFLIPIFLREPLMIDGLRTRITTAFSGGKAMQGLYAHNPDTFAPTGLPLVSQMDMSTTVVTDLISTFAPIFAQRVIWGAFEADNATVRLHYVAPTDLGAARAMGSAVAGDMSNTGSGTNTVMGRVITNTYGIFPDLTGASLNNLVGGSSAAPLFSFRKG